MNNLEEAQRLTANQALSEADTPNYRNFQERDSYFRQRETPEIAALPQEVEVPEEETRDYEWWDDTADVLSNEWAIPSLYRWLTREQGEEGIDEDLLVNGMPLEEMQEFSEGIDLDLLPELFSGDYTNRTQIAAEADRLREFSEYRQSIDELGAKGTAAQVLAGVTDPATWFGGGAAYRLAKARNFLNTGNRFVRGGAVAAAPEVAAEAAIQTVNYDRDGVDMALAVALPFAIGGGTASFYGRRMERTANRQREEQLARLNQIEAENTRLRENARQPLRSEDHLRPDTRTVLSDDLVVMEYLARNSEVQAKRVSRGERKALVRERKGLEDQSVELIQSLPERAARKRGTELPGHLVAASRNRASDEIATGLEAYGERTSRIDQILADDDIGLEAQRSSSRVAQWRDGLIDLPPKEAEELEALRKELIDSGRYRAEGSPDMIPVKGTELHGPADPNRAQAVQSDIQGVMEDIDADSEAFLAKHNAQVADGTFVAQQPKFGFWQRGMVPQMLRNAKSATSNAAIMKLFQISAGISGDGVQTFTANETKQALKRSIDDRYYAAVGRNWERYLKFYGATERIRPARRLEIMKDLEYRTSIAIRYGEDFDKIPTPLTDKLRPGEAEILKDMAREASAAMETALNAAKEAGVRGLDDVVAESSYLPRRFDMQKINSLDEETVVALFKKGITEASDVQEELADKIARGFRTALIKRHESPVNTSVSAKGLDDEGLSQMKEIMQKNGVDLAEDELEALLRPFEMKSTGKSKVSAANRRLRMDETVSIQTNEGRVFLSDLTEQNSLSLVENYVEQMSGAAGLAKAGFRDLTEVSKTLQQAGKEVIQAGAVGSSEVKDLEILFNNLLGRSNFDNLNGNSFLGTATSRRNRIARGLRAYQSANLMGQAVLAQTAEFGSIVNAAGFRNMMQHVPELRKMMKAAERGELSNDTLDVVVRVLSIGQTRSHRRFGQVQSGLGQTDDITADGYSAALDSLQHKSLEISGMLAVTDIQRQLAAASIMQRMVKDALSGKQNISALRSMGIDADMQARIENHLRKDGAVRLENRMFGAKLEEIDADRFFKEDPEAAETFFNALDRWTHQTVMEERFGDLPKVMYGETAKMVFQFRRFMMLAYNKSTLHSIGTADRRLLSGLLASMFVTGLVYTVQSQMNALGRNDSDEYMQRQLGADSLADLIENPTNADLPKIAMSAASRTNQLAVPSIFLTTGLEYILGGPVVGETRSSGLSPRLLDISASPTGRTASKAADIGANIIAGTANMFGADREGGFGTAAGEAVELLPLYRLYGIHGAMKGLSQDLKETDE
ncbi:hypothetical protein [Bacterioplanoides sp.]|uniref:hypothetical protein n=1 Tax=Bacterioplanoides sp. TaxID=2066072 RepID=UPI003B0007FE